MNTTYKSSAMSLYATPTFWSGAARALDLGGTFDVYRSIESGDVADECAVAADWAAVGGDLEIVLQATK